MRVIDKLNVIVEEIERGQTLESGTVRIHRYNDSIEITDLTFAGKRGKLCHRASIMVRGDNEQGEIHDICKKLSAVDNYADALKIILKAEQDAPPKTSMQVHQSTQKGVDTVPKGKGPISFMSHKLSVKVSLDNGFFFRNLEDPNEETLIDSPPKKTDMIIVYRWVEDNIDLIKEMDFQQVRKALNSLGIHPHYYLGMD